MGYIRHHAIVVTCFDYETIKEAYQEANNIGLITTPISSICTNGYSSFLICPDGSKEGWDTSNEFDEKRIKFIEYLRSIVFKKGYSTIEWVLICYGSDDNNSKIIEDAWTDYDSIVNTFFPEDD